MKRFFIALVVFSSLTAQAQLAENTEIFGLTFDFKKFFTSSVAFARGIAVNLEQVRLFAQSHVDVREQWDNACETTQGLYSHVDEFNKQLISKKVNAKYCAPITIVISFQTEIIKNCQNYYSKPVPENFDALMRKFMFSVIQTKMLMNKCFPELTKKKDPVPTPAPVVP